MADLESAQSEFGAGLTATDRSLSTSLAEIHHRRRRETRAWTAYGNDARRSHDERRAADDIREAYELL